MSPRKFSLIPIAVMVILLGWWLSKKKRPEMPNEGKLSFKTYSVHEGWGYRIFASDTILLIQQDVVPGLPGTIAFETESQAAQTAGLVVAKISKGIFPPTVSLQELDSMKVLPVSPIEK
jgi:hypothetical protein